MIDMSIMDRCPFCQKDYENITFAGWTHMCYSCRVYIHKSSIGKQFTRKFILDDIEMEISWWTNSTTIFDYCRLEILDQDQVPKELDLPLNTPYNITWERLQKLLSFL